MLSLHVTRGDNSVKSLGLSMINTNMMSIFTPPIFCNFKTSASVKVGVGGQMHWPANPSAAGPSNDKNQALFLAAMDDSGSKIEREDSVILPENECGAPGTKDYCYNWGAATKYLVHNFGVAKHFICSIAGKVEDDDTTKNQ